MWIEICCDLEIIKEEERPYGVKERAAIFTERDIKINRNRE